MQFASDILRSPIGSVQKVAACHKPPPQGNLVNPLFQSTVWGNTEEMNEIEVRHSRESDIEQIRLIYAEPSSYSATLQFPYPSPDLWEKKLGDLPEGSFSLVACRSEEVLGQLSIAVPTNLRRRHAANLGMGVRFTARRQGIGTTLLAAAIDLAEKWMAVRRIELEVYTDNVAAIALYKKFGFTIEGTLRQYAFRNGEFVDAHVMARLAA